MNEADTGRDEGRRERNNVKQEEEEKNNYPRMV